MREFDELLDEVLRSQPEPQEGIERRVLLRVSAGARSASLRRKVMWMGIAASLLLAVGIVRVVVLRMGSSRRVETGVAATEVVGLPDGVGEAVQVQRVAGNVGIKRKRLVRRATSAAGVHRQESDKIAQIEIAPLSIEPIGVFSEGFTKHAREVKVNEDFSWSVVLVCDGRVGDGDGTDGKAGVECGRSVVRYALLSTDTGAEVYGERGRAAGTGASEHHD